MATLIDLKNTKKRLDKVSPSFCLAKWTQVTLRLADGFNHSCHSPSPHHTPLHEIEELPSALHNTKFKKSLRQQMMDGDRPAECDYCWIAEDSKDPNVYSDRIKKSNSFWSAPYYDSIVNDPMQDINPAYVEVSFNNACNLKCSYCSPTSSSKWAEEIKQYGPYPLSGSADYNDLAGLVKQRDYNPYIEAFWKWWPSLYKDLKVFRITGGEPLLSKETFRVMKLIAENPKDDFSFEINTNLSVPDELIDKLIDGMKKIKLSNKTIYTSCESYGQKAEYSRYGLNYEKWKQNCKRILTELPDCKLTIMSAYNVFSVTSYKEFVTDVASLHSGNRLVFDVAFVRSPPYLSVLILDDTFEKYIVEQISLFEELKRTPTEINGIKRVLSVFRNRTKDEGELHNVRRDFVKFVNEYDIRRNVDFLNVFPEMEQFYYDCFMV